MFDPYDTEMLFLLLKNAKDSSLAESSCLTLALATHTKKSWHWPHIQRKLSLLMAKEEDHTKCLKVMFFTITNFKK